MIRVLIVDDHAVLRSGLRLLIDNEIDMEVVGEAGDCASAYQCIETFRPDVVLVDIALPDCTGIEIIRHFKQEKQSNCHFLVLTMHDEKSWLRPTLNAGAAGFVVKSVADDELINAIRTVHGGQIYMRSEAVSVLVDDSLITNLPENMLSEREIDVLKLVAHGYTNSEIGNQLHLSPKTIDTYRRRVMQKLRLETRADLVDYALKQRLLIPQ